MIAAAHGVRLERAPSRSRASERPSRVPPWVRALLRVPLAGKLAGANALIVLAAISVSALLRGSPADDHQLVQLLGIALGGSLVVNVALVILALRPLRDLEATAERIWHGDLDARVPRSLLADADMTRVGSTVNRLLDGLTSDRARMRRLAEEVIRAGERERAIIAHELHDSTAQTLAALLLHLSAIVRDITDPALAERLGIVKEAATDALAEVRALSHAAHPRVLDDLGLVAALRNLARRSEDGTGVVVTVEELESVNGLSKSSAAVLYRVAQEAVSNALRHAAPQNIQIEVGAADGMARMTIADDGRGFDVAEAERRRPGMGLFTMRERVSLIDGRFEISSRPSAGTRVRIEVPFDPIPDHVQ